MDAQNHVSPYDYMPYLVLITSIAIFPRKNFMEGRGLGVSQSTPTRAAGRCLQSVCAFVRVALVLFQSVWRALLLYVFSLFCSWGLHPRNLGTNIS